MFYKTCSGSQQSQSTISHRTPLAIHTDDIGDSVQDGLEYKSTTNTHEFTTDLLQLRIRVRY